MVVALSIVLLKQTMRLFPIFAKVIKSFFSTMVPYMNAMVELAKNRVPLYHIMDVAKQMENN